LFFNKNRKIIKIQTRLGLFIIDESGYHYFKNSQNKTAKKLSLS